MMSAVSSSWGFFSPSAEPVNEIMQLQAVDGRMAGLDQAQEVQEEVCLACDPEGTMVGVAQLVH